MDKRELGKTEKTIADDSKNTNIKYVSDRARIVFVEVDDENEN